MSVPLLCSWLLWHYTGTREETSMEGIVGHPVRRINAPAKELYRERDGGRKMRYTFRTCFVLSSFISAKGMEGLPLVVAVVVGNEQEYRVFWAMLLLDKYV